MTGSLVVHGVQAPKYKSFAIDTTAWPPRFTKLELVCSDGNGRTASLAYTDPRRFGKVLLRLIADPTAVEPIAALAADALDPPPLTTFISLLGRLSAPVKAVLLDQNKLVAELGIGLSSLRTRSSPRTLLLGACVFLVDGHSTQSWPPLSNVFRRVADECLYQASLAPSAPASSLSEAQVVALRNAILDICRHACECNADSERFPSTWLFHYRWAGMTTGSIDSPIGRIHFDTVGGRTTAFLPSKQRKGERPPIALVSTRKRPRTKHACARPSVKQQHEEGKPGEHQVVERAAAARVVKRQEPSRRAANPEQGERRSTRRKACQKDREEPQ
eukprot:CAMPEP_0183341104 /NCGR_PEP_ID=MMETSP0164_2-20130417/7419_1 /TAXON_ID=221442 /ORGANISM="Coccolithus pelagicus ssp braarudi, Strain PLY182g" /LENGTH=330 /DNA_ID=CAMNT_0025511335 /DNA_START=21 /DNA_END=1014 /DNA_ORIENTATION=+